MMIILLYLQILVHIIIWSLKELDSEINIKSKNCIPSKYELIVNLNVLKLSKNHLFTVEVHFEYPLIHILKSDFSEEKSKKIIL